MEFRGYGGKIRYGELMKNISEKYLKGDFMGFRSGRELVMGPWKFAALMWELRLSSDSNNNNNNNKNLFSQRFGTNSRFLLQGE